MLFWIICAAMTFAAVIAVINPYLRQTSAPFDGHDLEVYKDQLKEIDADEKRKLISQEEAGKARVEISRRILKADIKQTASAAAMQKPRSKHVVAIAILTMPVFTWGLYAYLGSPNMPDQPINGRSDASLIDDSLSALVAKAEGHLANNPNDGKGWEVLGPIYLRMSRYQDAVFAFNKAGELNGPSAEYEIGIARAIAAMNGGINNEAARAALERASALEPLNPKPKLLLAADLAEQGHFNQAKVAYENLLSSAPQDAPWRAHVIEMIARVDMAISAKTVAPLGNPTLSEIDQAAELPDADRNAMIEAMVTSLSEKLLSKPSDLEGWKRLLLSYSVLKKPLEMQEAYQRAIIGLQDNPSALAEIKDLATQLKIANP